MGNSNDPNAGHSITGRPILRVQRWMRPISRFLEIEATSGILLLLSAIVALAISNSELATPFHHLLEYPLGLSWGKSQLAKPLHFWINDGLMTIFFFVVGLEIKRELVHGELSDPKRMALPAAGAIGGMVVPAGLYFFMQKGLPGEQGWGIPMATDIAFVVGCLAVMGNRIPHGLKIFLLALAIVDDIGAVIAIAIFYSGEIHMGALMWGVVGILVCPYLNAIGVRKVPIYFFVGTCVWFAFLASGVHPTVAGVVLGLLTPSGPLVDESAFQSFLARVHEFFQNRTSRPPYVSPHSVLREVALTARETLPPLERLEVGFHPWVAFLIMPLFALANAGVEINASNIGDPISIAVMVGLVLGKPLGIFLFSFVFVKLGVARLPSGVNWCSLLGAGCLGGIGFTMSLFIAGLALDVAYLDAAKVGILGGSSLSAMAGVILLLIFLPRSNAAPV